MEIRCPGCGHAHHASDDLVRKNAGKTARCQRCGYAMPLPKVDLGQVDDDDVLAMMQEGPPIPPPPSSPPQAAHSQPPPPGTLRAPVIQGALPTAGKLSYRSARGVDSGVKLRAPLGGTWEDFFVFRSMMMTRVIQVIVVLGGIVIVFAGIAMIVQALGSSL